MKNKKIQFLPGLGEKPKDYKELSRYFDILKVDWNTGKVTPSIKKANMLAGFSMGAVLACEYARKQKVGTLILCSLTPGAETLAQVRANEVIFLVGSKEKWVLKEIMRVRKTLKCKNKVIVISGTDHKVDAKYRKVLLNTVQNILHRS